MEKFLNSTFFCSFSLHSLTLNDELCKKNLIFADDCSVEAKKNCFHSSLERCLLGIDASSGDSFFLLCSSIHIRYVDIWKERWWKFRALSTASLMPFVGPFSISTRIYFFMLAYRRRPFWTRSLLLSSLFLCVLSIRRNISSITLAEEFQSLFFLLLAFLCVAQELTIVEEGGLESKEWGFDRAKRERILINVRLLADWTSSLVSHCERKLQIKFLLVRREQRVKLHLICILIEWECRVKRLKGSKMILILRSFHSENFFSSPNISLSLSLHHTR